MSRWNAALIHLCISATIAAIVAALLLLVWYPPPYFHAGGAGELLALVMGVDVTLGPLITFIVFKSGKQGLKFDLAVIGIVQTAALVYGFDVIVRTRPVFLVAAVDRFVLVDANQLARRDLAQASRPEWRHLSWTGPVLVGTRLPTDPKEHNALLFSTLSTGKDVQDFPKYYVPYTEAIPALLQRAQPVHTLLQLYPGKHDEIDAWLKRHAVGEAQVLWLPIQARNGDLVMMVHAKDGQPIGALAINPWPVDATPATGGATRKPGEPGEPGEPSRA
ncbi:MULTISPECIES: TfpX/TfpZ family type IV pilin accessory protein [unclassified Rhodanobacter]|uniref:TfpX/TfpZ family type IV pilin accessory protein n=1 Tax=Rhodanobacter humi TaxID=1888173 RepID=A0ABV4AT62_9GAMM